MHVPSPQLVITGAVHISQTLAPVGQLLGYDVTIVDPRTAFASIERFPDVKVIAEWPDVALPPLNVDHYTAFVALTHDPKIDDPALKHALARDCFYIGALGSKKTHAKRVQRLKEAGLSDADIARIHAPIGLAIGAVSPAEIAISIMAEITARLRLKVGEGGGGMKFGPVAPADALGATAVHSIRQGDLVLKKGTLIGPAEVAALKAAGVKEIVVARLEPGDVSEDQAAADIASAVQGEGVRADRAFTGRCNLFAETAGVLVLDKDAIDRLNRIDEAVTLATLPAFKPVVEGEMIATVKIIPFAVAATARDKAVAEAAQAKPVIRVAPYKVRKIGIVSTLLPGLSPKVVDKTLKITAARIAPAGATIVAERRVPHATPALAARHRRGAQSRRRIGDRVRRLRHRRPARRHPGGGRGGRRRDRAFRHAGRSRQSDADRPLARAGRDRRARLRALAEGKRFRLGTDAAPCRVAGQPRRYHRHGRRRPA